MFERISTRLIAELPETVFPFIFKELPFKVKVITLEAMKERLSPSVVVVPVFKIIRGSNLPAVVNVLLADKVTVDVARGVYVIPELKVILPATVQTNAL